MTNDRKLLLKVFDCLVQTAQYSTDLENVYNDSSNESVSWAEVYEARALLFEEDKP